MEDASEVRLGEEFQEEECMSNAFVAIVLQEAKANFEKEDKAVPEVFEQTLAYVNRFSQIKDPIANKGVVDELENELRNKTWERTDENGNPQTIKLHHFEVISLINLKPEEYDEACSLVPSLQSKLTEEEVNDVLEKISRSAGRTFAS
ncbi:DNA-directed RNA polymerase II subunit RPB4 [Hondaea fermentalgiana]|uniref:DNA-directed RNA polymerase II subunit RPB4 n=1 Tax=Hondaea fermentalgiana TaxID=2315210 RepID=A0A2R5FYN9_9STRA|nr:DNA-directed RNA polymerase II subunit RPB4 [Hondaea fermentalgiana]|eukprot:GBG23876.1 DNA-directed RNA polymerase II subunit RPB4 [Hondaea fermentalgiana]